MQSFWNLGCIVIWNIKTRVVKVPRGTKGLQRTIVDREGLLVEHQLKCSIISPWKREDWGCGKGLITDK